MAVTCKALSAWASMPCLPSLIWQIMLMTSVASLQAIPVDLSRLKRLKLLQLDKNRITSIPEEVLQNCESLQTLSLHGNPITAEVRCGTLHSGIVDDQAPAFAIAPGTVLAHAPIHRNCPADNDILCPLRHSAAFCILWQA